MIRRTFTATLLAAIALAAPAALAGAAGWSAPTYPLAKSNGPALAVNARGDTVLAAASTTGVDVTLRAAGAAFGQPITLTPVAASFARAAINARGDVVVAWNEGTNRRYTVRPAGGSFGPIHTIAAGAASTLDYIRVAIDDTGEIAVAWAAYDGANTVVRYGMTDLSGTNADLTAYGQSGAGRNADGQFSVAMNGRGDALVAWDRTNGTNYIAQVATRAAGATSFSPASTDVSPTGANASSVAADVAADGRAVVAWTSETGSVYRPQVAYRTANGLFSLPTTVTAGSAEGFYAVPALSDGEDVAVGWIDRGSGSIAARTGTFGQPFGSAVSTFSSGGSAPSIDMAPNGRAAVIWGANPGPSLHTAFREPGDTGFAETPTVSSDLAFWFANVAVTPIALDGTGDAVAAWGAFGSKQAFAVQDITGPELRSFSVPASGTAGAPVREFGVEAFDTFSAVGAPHWDFGDGAGADGSTAAHTYAAAGTYTVKVTATDAAGNATSATRTIAVGAPLPAGPAPKPPTIVEPLKPSTVTCKVPKLTGLTYARAKAKLRSAHCAVGKTKKPKGRKTTKNLVVKAQSRRAGTVTKAGAKVDITMKVKPKKKAKRK